MKHEREAAEDRDEAQRATAEPCDRRAFQPVERDENKGQGDVGHQSDRLEDGDYAGPTGRHESLNAQYVNRRKHSVHR